MRAKPAQEKESQKRKKKAESSPCCRLEQIRATQGISIVQLAQDAGVHRHSIAKIENGALIGNLSTHFKLMETLGVSPDEYFGFISAQPVKDKPEILDSRKGFTVELLPSIAGKIKRIQIPPGETASLKSYLDPEKPVFFYVVQGEIKFERKNEVYEQGVGAALSFPRAISLSIKNTSSLGGVLLAIQH